MSRFLVVIVLVVLISCGVNALITVVRNPELIGTSLDSSRDEGEFKAADSPSADSCRVKYNWILPRVHIAHKIFAVAKILALTAEIGAVAALLLLGALLRHRLIRLSLCTSSLIIGAVSWAAGWMAGFEDLETIGILLLSGGLFLRSAGEVMTELPKIIRALRILRWRGTRTAMALSRSLGAARRRWGAKVCGVVTQFAGRVLKMIDKFKGWPENRRNYNLDRVGSFKSSKATTSQSCEKKTAVTTRKPAT